MLTLSGAWNINLQEMTCKNILTKIEVEFAKDQKEGFCGKIRYMPMELLEKCAGKQFGDYYIREVIMDAQVAFLKAYYKNDLKKTA
jgi:hypothetical protein